MAMSHYRNLLDMGFFDDLDDSNFDDDFDFAVVDIVQKDDTVMKCPECTKTYKTTGGLQRHIKTKHSKIKALDDTVLLDKKELEELLVESVVKVKAEGCWPDEVISTLSLFNCVVSDELVVKVNGVVSKFLVLNDPDIYFEEFYGSITIDSTDHLIGLPLDAANILMIQFGELVMAYLKRRHTAPPCDATNPPQIMDCEVDALQYISGYVIHKFLKKAKNDPKYKSKTNQSIIIILEELIDRSRELRLVDSLNRGGLIPISKECELLFFKAEELFRLETSVLNLRKVDIPLMSAKLMIQPDIVSTINCVVNSSGCDISTEEKNNLFEKMIQLYLRVRSFALARDITSSCNKNTVKPKEKGLRKALRQTEDEPS